MQARLCRVGGLAAFALALCAFLQSLALAEVAVPPLQARVTDLTGTLTADQKDALERRLATFERAKGSQLAVLLLPTTQPETIEQYAIRVVDQWKLGRKGIDDGVLIVLAKDDRAVRIEVGYGLEGAIPDAVADRIVEDVMIPHLRQGDFFRGISAGIDRIIGVIEGEPLPAPRERSPQGPASWVDFVPLAFIIALFAGGLLRAMFGRLLGAAFTGGLIGFLVWIVGGALFIALVTSVLVFFFTLAGGIGGRGYYGGWPGGFGRGGGGGDIFRGGGGGFGGGGASGRW
jgi:uncharacterized protein